MIQHAGVAPIALLQFLVKFLGGRVARDELVRRRFLHLVTPVIRRQSNSARLRKKLTKLKENILEKVNNKIRFSSESR